VPSAKYSHEQLKPSTSRSTDSCLPGPMFSDLENCLSCWPVNIRKMFTFTHNPINQNILWVIVAMVPRMQSNEHSHSPGEDVIGSNFIYDLFIHYIRIYTHICVYIYIYKAFHLFLLLDLTILIPEICLRK
jgi:hypothetical protein